MANNLYTDGSATSINTVEVRLSAPFGKEGQVPSANVPIIIDEVKDFNRACHKLEGHLQSFVHHVQELGSAFGLFKASRKFRSNLSRVRGYFGANKSTKMNVIAPSLGQILVKIKETNSSKHTRIPKHLDEKHFHGSPMTTKSNAETLIVAFEKLAESAYELHSVDFEYYEEDEVNKALQRCEIELRIFSGGLKFFSIDGESLELAKFVKARLNSLTMALDSLSDSLNQFKADGIPQISFRQKHSSKMLFNATTVATFFASVTATTLQYSVESTSTKREVATNTLWFASLVLSIGGAITGVITMSRRLAVFSSPIRLLPRYVRFWFRSGYLVLLTASVVAFLAGLVLYVFDTMPMYSFWVVVACSLLSVLALATVLAMFLKETYSFYSFRRVGNELRKDITTVYEYADETWWSWLRFHLFDQLRKGRRTLVDQRHDLKDANMDQPGRSTGLLRLVTLIIQERRKNRRRETEDSEAGVRSEKKYIPFWPRKSESSARQSTRNQDHGTGSQHQRPSRGSIGSNFAALLTGLGETLSVPAHTQAVHLQFSPDGRWLVVCYRYECCVFEVHSAITSEQGTDAQVSFIYHTTLHHFRKNAKQVEWSPGGMRLITRQSESVRVWKVNDTRFETEGIVNFDNTEEITDIQWFDDSQFLVIADKSKLYRVTLSGNSRTPTLYNPVPDPSLKMRRICMLPDSDLVFILADYNIRCPNGDKGIGCIIGYELKSAEDERRDGSVKRCIPLMNTLESLAISSHVISSHVDSNTKTRRLVISYSDKLPELWTMTTDNRQVLFNVERELTIGVGLNEVKDNEPEFEWGKAFLIGPDQDIVACTKGGVMHFWDVKSPSNGSFHGLRIIAGNEEMEELPLVSWAEPRASGSVPMMATAGKGMSLKIWTPTNGTTQDMTEQRQEALGSDVSQGYHPNSNDGDTAEPASEAIPSNAHTSLSPTIALPGLHPGHHWAPTGHSSGSITENVRDSRDSGLHFGGDSH